VRRPAILGRALDWTVPLIRAPPIRAPPISTAPARARAGPTAGHPIDVESIAALHDH